MRTSRQNFVLFALMFVASGLAVGLRPTHKIADDAPGFALENAIPRSFGDWREYSQQAVFIIDPQQQETVNRIYSQTLSRTYENNVGYRIMLSIAYGVDQRDSLSMHYPEVCYPAQGFQLLSNRKSEILLGNQKLPVRRLETLLGTRHEPITYWTMIGTVPTLGGVDKKIAEMSYGLRGKIPDGLLFRVSSIDNDTSHAFQMQEQFVTAIATAMKHEDKHRLVGIDE